MRIRDPGWKNSDPGSGMEKIRIRDKHPGSATPTFTSNLCSTASFVYFCTEYLLEDGGIQPRTAAMLLITRLHLILIRLHLPCELHFIPCRPHFIHTWLYLFHIRLHLIYTRLHLIHTGLHFIHTWLYLFHIRLYLIYTRLHFIHTWLYLFLIRLYLIHTRLHLIHTSYISSTLPYISSTRCCTGLISLH
jgi:hypothetical protein